MTPKMCLTAPKRMTDDDQACSAHRAVAGGGGGQMGWEQGVGAVHEIRGHSETLGASKLASPPLPQDGLVSPPLACRPS